MDIKEDTMLAVIMANPKTVQLFCDIVYRFTTVSGARNTFYYYGKGKEYDEFLQRAKDEDWTYATVRIEFEKLLRELHKENGGQNQRNGEDLRS